MDCFMVSPCCQKKNSQLEQKSLSALRIFPLAVDEPRSTL
jgi:hypothetical protein